MMTCGTFSDRNRHAQHPAISRALLRHHGLKKHIWTLRLADAHFH